MQLASPRAGVRACLWRKAFTAYTDKPGQKWPGFFASDKHRVITGGEFAPLTPPRLPTQPAVVPGPFHPLVEQWKTLSGPVTWSIPDSADGAVSFLAPLDIDGVTVADFALRGGAYEKRPDAAVMLQLEVGMSGMRTRIPLSRIDWRPISPIHKNPDRSILRGSHVHLFARNWLELEQRMRRNNLPVATALPGEVASYAALLDLAKGVFRIANVHIIPEPEWSPTLL